MNRVAAAILVLAAVLRLATLDGQSFWLDEAYTVRVLDGSLPDVLDRLPESESAGPAYYVLAWGWTQAFGLGEVGVRSLSALLGAATAGVAYVVGARLGGRTAGAVAGGLVAVHPLLVWFSQEARAYALVALLAALSLLCLVRILDGAGSRWWAAWAATAVLALATHYFAAFLVVAEAGWLVLRFRRDPRLVRALAAVALGGLALLPLVLAQQETGNTDYIGESSLPTRLLQVPKQLLVGYASPSQALTAVVAALLAASALALLGVAARRRAPGATRAVGALALALVAVALVVVLAVAGADLLNTRNLLVVLPVVLIALACGFAAPRAQPAGLALGAGLGAVLLAVTVLVAAEPRFQRDDWRGAAAALPESARPEPVLISPGSGWMPTSLYRPDLRRLPEAGVPSAEVVLVGLAPRATSGRDPVPVAPTALAPPLEAFRRVAVTTDEVFTVARYRAPADVVVTPASLGPSALWPGDASAMTVRR